MAATPYRPVAFTDQSLTVEKLNQTSNNIQWLFENTARMRYNTASIVRDNGIKIIAGKTPFPIRDSEAIDVTVYFGSFFNAACKPIVTTTVETTGGWLRKFNTVRGIGAWGTEIDYRGFIAHVSTHESHVANKIEAPGWVHWQAIGF